MAIGCIKGIFIITWCLSEMTLSLGCAKIKLNITSSYVIIWCRMFLFVGTTCMSFQTRWIKLIAILAWHIAPSHCPFWWHGRWIVDRLSYPSWRMSWLVESLGRQWYRCCDGDAYSSHVTVAACKCNIYEYEHYKRTADPNDVVELFLMEELRMIEQGITDGE